MSNVELIRNMSKYELQLFILKHKKNGKIIPFQKLLSGRYNKEDSQLASDIIYAKNRLRLLT